VNPRALAAWSAACLAVVLVSTAPAPRVVVLLAAANVVVTFARPGTRLRGLVVALVVASLSAVVLDLLLSHNGDHVLLTAPGAIPVFGGRMTLEAALYGADVALGIAAAMLAVAPLVTALDPHEAIDALPSFLHRTGTAAGAALNLIPGLQRSAAAVLDAQRMRGWRARGPRSWAEIIVPTVVTAMEDSLGLAEAMEARAYGSGRRTRAWATPWSSGDRLVAASALIAVVAVVVARAAGLDDDWSAFPTPLSPALSALPLAAALLLLTPLVAWRPRASAV
jgi:energy-coupling factor transport system permease protein